MNQKITFPNYFDIGIKNAEFDAEFESVEKVAKNVYTKKVIGLRTLVHSSER